MPTVLVTRPSHQQTRFIQLCQQNGYETLCLPLIRIEPRDTDESSWKKHITDPHTAWIFTSRNAVEHSPITSQPAGSVFAMGASTARVLEQRNFTVAIEPNVPFNSEALIDQLALFAARQAVVVTGVGGRAYLTKELRGMNWDVTEIACYERIPETHSTTDVHHALANADLLSLTSIESMDVLVDLAKPLDLDWQHKPIFVNSQRAITAARTAGFSGYIGVASPAGDIGQINAITAWLDTPKND